MEADSLASEAQAPLGPPSSEAHSQATAMARESAMAQLAQEAQAPPGPSSAEAPSVAAGAAMVAEAPILPTQATALARESAMAAVPDSLA